jgi:hypothetical protein
MGHLLLGTRTYLNSLGEIELNIVAPWPKDRLDNFDNQRMLYEQGGQGGAIQQPAEPDRVSAVKWTL